MSPTREAVGSACARPALQRKSATVAHYVQPGDVLVEKYVVERVLGEGGMALVVAARHLQLHQTVAIKLMRARALAFPDAVDRFIREAQTVVRLRSENVARVMDVGTLDDGSPFMVMEHLEGVDLAMVLAHRGALAVEDAVDYVLQACAAMVEAHGEGIIHRDIKPGNLFLTQRPNGAPLVKVLDFGISKASPGGQAEGITQTQDFGTMGSPPYMSPEQARSAKHVDVRSDIWSLGVVLYHLISGELPFFADNVAEVFAQILYEEPTDIRHAAPWVSRRLGAVIMRCLEKDPDDRYADVTELVAALAPHASAEGRLLIDASLLPTRRGSNSLSAPFMRLSSSELIDEMEDLSDDGDTMVDPGRQSASARQPSRLQLSELFDELPARSLDDAYPRTTHALYTGEILLDKVGRPGRRRRRLWTVAGVAIVVALAALVLFVFPGVGRSWIPGLDPAVPAAAVPGEDELAAEFDEQGDEQGDEGADDEPGEDADELVEIEEHDEGDRGEAEKAASGSDTASGSKAGGEPKARSPQKRRPVRKTTKRKPTTAPKNTDPFGTIR
jgi:serine/threonine protein kinase